MKVYKKNSFDYFVVPFYRRLTFYIFLFSFLVLFFYIFMVFTDFFNYYIQIFFFLSLIILIIIFFIRILFLYQKILKYKSNFFKSKSLEKRILISLIDTMLLNSPKKVRRIKVPNIFVNLSDFKSLGRISVEIERLAGMDDVKKFIPLVSNAFNINPYRDFAVVDFEENANKMNFLFVLENVKVDKTLIPKNVSELLDEDLYIFYIQNDFSWDLIKYPHLICSGKTGSGKSTLLLSLLIQSIHRQIETYIIDPKKEFSVLKESFSDPQEILSLLKLLVENMEQREKEISEKVENFGETAKDLGYKPVLIFIDEVTALIAGFDSKEHKQFEKILRKLILKGRALGYTIILMAQNFNSETLSVAIRNQPALRIILGENSSEDYRFIFGSNVDTVSDGIVSRFTGYYICNGLTRTPQKFFVPNLHKYGLNDIKNFKLDYNGKML